MARSGFFLALLVLVTSCFDFAEALRRCRDGGRCTAGAEDGGDGGDFASAHVCGSNGWCWATPTPRNAILSLATLGRDEAWAVGADGLVMRFDGTAWRPLKAPLVDFRLVAGSAPGTVLFGSAAGLFRYEGGRLAQVAALGASSITDFDTAPDGTAAVVTQPGSVCRLADDTACATLPSPGFEVNGVAFTPAGGLWAVGNGGSIAFGGGSPLAWSRTPSGTTNHVYGVVAPSADEAWATAEGAQLLHHTDGGWTTVASPLTNGIRGLSAEGPSSVWIADDQFHLLRWNGTALESLTVDFNASALSVRDGGGWIGGYRGELSRLEGTSVRPFAQGTFATIADVHGTGPDDVWAATAGGEVLHWDGAQPEWAATKVSSSPIGAVFAVKRDDVWAGGNGAAFHFTGSAWAQVDLPTKVQSLFVSPAGTVWIAGERSLFVYDRGAATAVPVAAAGALTSLSGAGDTVWAASDVGELFRCAVDAGCVAEAPPTDAGDNLAAFAVAADTLFATSGDQVHRRRGGTWARLRTDGAPFATVRGDGTGRGVYAIGRTGHVYHYDADGTELDVSAKVDHGLSSGFSTADGGVTFVVGPFGAILRREGGVP